MPYNFRRYEPKQLLLLPPSLEDWVPKESLARFVSDTVDLMDERGRAAYKQRGSTIEAVFGQMVMRGLTRFVLRGIAKVRAEWALWCATHNLLKLWRAGAPLVLT